MTEILSFISCHHLPCTHFWKPTNATPAKWMKLVNAKPVLEPSILALKPVLSSRHQRHLCGLPNGLWVVLTVCVESTKLCHPGTFLAFDRKYDSCMSSFLVPLLMPVTVHSAHCNRRLWHRFQISTRGSDSFLMSCQFSITGLYHDLTGPLLTNVRTGY